MPSTVPVTISINVSPLPDNSVWFANSAAWSAYWALQGFTANIPAADTLNYGVVKMAATNVYVDPGTTQTATYTIQLDLLGNGVFTNVVFPSQQSFEELKTQVTALNNAVKSMRIAMVTAGLISQAQ